MKFYNGKTLRQWSEETGIPEITLRARMQRRNLSIEEAIEFKPIDKKCMEGIYNGKTLRQWSEETGISIGSIRNRMQRKNLSIEEAIEYKIEKKCNGRIYNGKTLIEWGNVTGINPNTLRTRMERNMTIEEAIEFKKPDMGRRYNGKTLRQWSEETGIHKNKLQKRINRGLDIEDAISYNGNIFTNEGFIYFILLTNKPNAYEEYFYKIGISEYLPEVNRLKRIKVNYNILEIIKIQKFNTLQKARDIETIIKQNVIPYIPCIKFGGYTECFKADNILKEQIIDLIEDFR